MYYGDKQSAKVKISYELENRGWKIFGFREDQSDSMTDYFCPAHWEGVAEKNGYVLLIDVYNNSYSGKEITKRNPDASQVNHEKINKLQAKANDEAASENERQSCRNLIEKEMGKLKNQFVSIGNYPVFTSGNPGKCSWHVEKDGQIIAKGTGVFSCLEYDWEDETKTKQEQQQEKIIALINRIEKTIADNSALVPEVVKVAKEVIKPVEKEDKTINKGDILSFSHRGHYWIVNEIYTHGEETRIVYEVLGSASRGYLRKKNAQRYYQSLNRLEKEMEAGKVKVYTLQEVTEYEDKVVYKKTGRKQKQNFDAVTLNGTIEEKEESKQEKKVVEVKAQYNFTIKESKHTKTGETIYVVNVDVRLSKEEFAVLNTEIKALGGYYSSFKPNNGFIFKNDPTAILEALNGADSTKEKESISEIVDSVIDYTASLLIENKPETEEQKESFANKVDDYLKKNKYNKKMILKYVQENFSTYKYLLEALVYTKNKHNSKEENKQDQGEYIAKIDKQIESNKKKLDSLSGDHLTNTWKRQKEEAHREDKREALRFDIVLLEYLKVKAANNSMTQLDVALLVGSFRESMKMYHNQKYKYKHEIKYPTIDLSLPKDGWWNLEVPAKQKRLNKANITDTRSLLLAIEEYDLIAKEIVTPTNPITAKIKRLEAEAKLKKIEGYFPTPKSIVERMIAEADIQDGETVLEPSAGNGNILDGITASLKSGGITANIRGIEWNCSLREILELKKYDVVGDDFLQHVGQYDKIVMNPPFEKNQDVLHVQHAYECLKPGGRIVSIMSPHWTFARDSKSVEFREWLDSYGTWEKLPEGSFKESGTGTNTVLVIIDKPFENAVHMSA